MKETEKPVVDFASLSAIVAIEDQASADLVGEVAILNLRNGVYYGLNLVGTRIWNLIQSPKSFQEIVNAVMADYDVDRERCEADLRQLLGELQDHGLIELVP